MTRRVCHSGRHSEAKRHTECGWIRVVTHKMKKKTVGAITVKEANIELLFGQWHLSAEMNVYSKSKALFSFCRCRLVKNKFANPLLQNLWLILIFLQTFILQDFWL